MGAVAVYFFNSRKKTAEDSLTIEAIIHELKTPLTGLSWIFGFLSEIKPRDEVTEEMIGFIKEGRSKIGNALDLANDALTALNTSVDSASYKFEKNDLVAVLKRVVEENSLTAKEKSVKISLDVHGEVQEFPFDLVKLTLAIRNVVNNAVKYNKNGGGVSISVHEDKDRAVISVSDTGIGIPAVDLPKMFNKFFRAKNTEDNNGSGLGLFIVKNIVAGHGGEVDIQSKEGEGTKVTITLPIKHR